MKQLGPWSWRPLAMDGAASLSTWVGPVRVSTVDLFPDPLLARLGAFRGLADSMGYRYETALCYENLDPKELAATVVLLRYLDADKALHGHRVVVEALACMSQEAPRFGQCVRCGLAYAAEGGGPLGNLCNECWVVFGFGLEAK